ncbi:MAG: ABC transporter permease [Clostridiales bacterium]|nr:ABC transporter permease [Clostridiales bacterium]
MKRISKKLIGLAVFIGVIILWAIGSKVVKNSLFLPTPKETLDAVILMYKTGALWKHLYSTFMRVTIAICITGVISIPLGMAIAWYKPVNIIVNPIIKALRYIPVTAFSPIMVLLLGIDEQMKISFLVIATTFSFLPTVIQTCMDDSNERLKETAYTMGFSYTRTLLHVLIPYLTPSLLKSFITLYGVGWTFVIIAETTNTQYGLGHLMYIGSARGRTDTVFAAIVIIIVVSFLFDKIANYIINKKFSWRYKNED